LFDNGLRLDALTGVRVSAIRVGDDAAFDGGTILASTATLGLDLTWPLMRGSRAATEMLTPRIQLLATDNHPGNDAVPNEDSQQIEFDETNLFALSRYPGVDQAETGLRANIGLSYLRSAASGWELGLTGGRVFRLGSESEFSDGSGLGSAVSDYVAAATLTWRDRVAMRARVLVDPDLAFKRAETSLGLRQESYALDASYLHLDADANAGAPDARNEVALGGRWQFRPSWELAASGRYDLTRDRPIEWAGGLTFGNECIRAELSVSRSFATSDNVPQATVFGLSVNLAGFGADPEGVWQASACGP
jgi:LPS-assembly protein